MIKTRRLHSIAFIVLCWGAFICAGCSTEVFSSSGRPIDSPSRKAGPPKVEPIVLNGLKYGGGFNEGAMPIFDAATGKLVKTIKIYDPGSEPVFFRSMKLINGNKDILIENEKGLKYVFHIKSQRVKPLDANR